MVARHRPRDNAEIDLLHRARFERCRKPLERRDTEVRILRQELFRALGFRRGEELCRRRCLDDLALIKYRETVDPKSPPITLLARRSLSGWLTLPHHTLSGWRESL